MQQCHSKLYFIRCFLMLLIILSLFSLFTTRSLACLCATPTPEEELANSDVVFAGKVKSIEKNSPSFYTNTTFPFIHRDYDVMTNVTFTTSQVWKGELSEEIRLQASFGGWCYNQNFTTGEEYLVFASIRDDELLATGCSNTDLLKSSDRTILQIGQGRPIQPITTQAQQNPKWLLIISAGLVCILFLGLWLKKNLTHISN